MRSLREEFHFNIVFENVKCVSMIYVLVLKDISLVHMRKELELRGIVVIPSTSGLRLENGERGKRMQFSYRG